MKTSSAKAKGRRLCLEVQEKLLEKLNEIIARNNDARGNLLTSDDLRVASSSVGGEDIQMSSRARALFNVAIECKNQEKLNVWEACEQAERHAEGTDRIPLLIFRRNKDKIRVALSLDAFLSLIFDR